MTNHTERKRSLSSRFINQYDAIGYNLWEISKSFKQILKNQDKQSKQFSFVLEEAANLLAGALIELERNKKLRSLLDTSKSKSAKSILYKIQFLEDELEAYTKLFDK